MMRKRHCISVLALLLGTASLLQAQGTGLFSALSKALTTPSRLFDTDYVQQLSVPWIVSAQSDLIWTGITLSSDIGAVDPGQGRMHFTKHLNQELFKKVGASLAYGSLQLGYTVEIDRHGTQRNRYFNLAFVRPSFGVSCQYYTVNEYLSGVYSLDWMAGTYPFVSALPGRIRHLVIDAFYFFNPNHFTYHAVTGRHLVQRRSAGSWLALVRYSQGEYQDDMNDAELDMLFDRIGSYRVGAFSLGAGYSFNWVPLHRDPAAGDRSLRGLRNLALNATLVPYFSLYDHLSTTLYHFMEIPDAQAAYLREHPEQASAPNLYGFVMAYRRAHGTALAPVHKGAFLRPSVNLAARVGIGFSLDCFSVSVTAVANRFSFRDIKSVTEGNGQRVLTVSRGSFYDVTTRLAVGYRF